MEMIIAQHLLKIVSVQSRNNETGMTHYILPK